MNGSYVGMVLFFYIYNMANTYWKYLSLFVAQYDAPSGEKDKYLKSEIHFIEF